MEFERNAQLSDAKRAVLQRWIRGGSEAAAVRDAIPARPRAERARLSGSQFRMWFRQSLAPADVSCNLCHRLRVHGQLDAARLRDALAELAARHEVLRTSFELDSGGPVQRVHATPAVSFEHVALHSAAVQPLDVDGLCSDLASQPFDLGRLPLWRCRLIQIAPDEHVLALVAHHTIFDGWSFGVLLRELNSLYLRRPLPPLALQYGDYAEWQHTQLPVLRERHAQFWLQQLRDAPRSLEWPLWMRPREPQPHGARYLHRRIESEQLAAIHAIARRTESSPFMLLFAALSWVLAAFTGQHCIPIGLPVANRGRPELEASIGCFINTMVIPVELRAGTFEQLLARVKQLTLEALAHQSLPIEAALQALPRARGVERTGLFNVLFVFQNAPAAAAELGGCTLRQEALHSGATQFDLSFYVEPNASTFEIQIESDPAQLTVQAVDAIWRAFSETLLRVRSRADVDIEQLDPLLSEVHP
jgi:Condensation domain